MNLVARKLDAGERRLAHMWKAVVVRGIVGIAFAVVILVWPNIGLATLTALFGAYALVSGVATLTGAFAVAARGSEKVWLVLDGVIGIAVGVVVWVWPGPSALALLYVIAAWAIAIGFLQLALAFVLPLRGGRSLLAGLAGLLSIAFGVIMFARPGAGAVALLALIAAFAFVTGVMQVAFGLELRSVASDLEHRVRPSSAATRSPHRPAMKGA